MSFCQKVFALLFLCVLSEVIATCLKDGIQWQNSCLYYNTTELGFVVAELYCQQIGGHLVSIHDAFTNQFIAEKAGQKFQNWYSYWIGGNTLIGGGSNWTWTDGTYFNYADWTNNEPGSPSDKQCILAAVNQGYWSTESCSRTRPFICSISTGVVTSPPLTTTTTRKTTTTPPQNPPTRTAMPTVQTYKNCSFGWVYFEPTNSCYGYNNKGLTMNWTMAETYCNNQGAHLASVHSYEELMFINVGYR
uniref:C-type lectin domain-containing protein n=1 Tax=Panagrolaimus sp. PS1159 TaxID=55785 RepID=A0AC35F679_9BILA